MRKQDGTVHFFVNGVDQGLCATNVPAAVYGVIDLYGQAAKATIVDSSGGSGYAEASTPSVVTLAYCNTIVLFSAIFNVSH